MLHASSTVSSVRPSVPLLLYVWCSLLRLITAKSIVEVLLRGRLRPLRVWLLTASIASSALRATIAHGRSAIACRRSGLRPSVVTGLTAVLSYILMVS